MSWTFIPPYFLSTGLSITMIYRGFIIFRLNMYIIVSLLPQSHRHTYLNTNNYIRQGDEELNWLQCSSPHQEENSWYTWKQEWLVMHWTEEGHISDRKNIGIYRAVLSLLTCLCSFLHKDNLVYAVKEHFQCRQALIICTTFNVPLQCKGVQLYIKIEYLTCIIPYL